MPLPFIAYFGYCLGYNVFVAHAFIKSILWSFPFLMVLKFRKNVVDNAIALIDSVNLLKCGTKVEIKNVYGNKKIVEIKNLRVPSQVELN